MSEMISTFRDLPLSDATLAILEERSFFEPTPVQALVIPRLLANECDLIARARTGTGKTAAYALPVIETLLKTPDEAKKPQPRALILAPTRELAMQISSEMAAFIGKRELKVVTVYGGQPVEIQLKFLRSGADIIVGTPGRVIDFMERKALKFDKLQFAILDEADEMLDMGFVEDIETILAATPEAKRTLMFSATMPEAARKIAGQFMQNAEFITVADTDLEESGALTEQWACEVRREDKFQALRRILAAEGKVYAMIFCRTRVDVDELTTQLQRHGFSAEALHGELTQNQRTRVIDQFKNHRFDMLIATDVAARGIDVNDLTHVINYAMPQNRDLYTHRIGRTGRAGKRGVAITLFTPSEGGKFATLRKATQGALEQRSIPDAKAIISAKKRHFADELADRMMHVNPVYTDLAGELAATLDIKSLIGALLEMRFKRELLSENYPPLSRMFRERADRKPRTAPRRKAEVQPEEKPETQEAPEVKPDKVKKTARPNLREWALNLEKEPDKAEKERITRKLAPHPEAGEKPARKPRASKKDTGKAPREKREKRDYDKAPRAKRTYVKKERPFAKERTRH